MIVGQAERFEARDRVAETRCPLAEAPTAVRPPRPSRPESSPRQPASERDRRNVSASVPQKWTSFSMLGTWQAISTCRHARSLRTAAAAGPYSLSTATRRCGATSSNELYKLRRTRARNLSSLEPWPRASTRRGITDGPRAASSSAALLCSVKSAASRQPISRSTSSGCREAAEPPAADPPADNRRRRTARLGSSRPRSRRTTLQTGGKPRLPTARPTRSEQLAADNDRT